MCDQESMSKYGIKDIFDFSIGKDVSDKEIQEWVKECESKVTKEHPFYYVRSGNTMVVSFFRKHSIETIITKNYIEKTIYN
jgi:hypothetical protein